ncbi:hypothetical protein C2845_PM11G06220 [Panicum miliaceum]|uniref:Retrotransposon protein, putative, unclassified n=1 Tax=Panicum miliaceum TaxID=4540 RepID=A0A3L6RTV4_PANMI|nr:hypothetical protein C2845_PM11G06220 [Panicum miliaceum]
MRTKLRVTFQPTLPKKSTADHGRKREGEGEGGSPPLEKEEGVVQWRLAGTDSSPWENTGIRPHFNLFCLLFRLKPQPDEDNPALVGGAGVQLRDKALYLEYTTPSSLSGWHAQWFYIGNHQPSLLRRDNAPPQRQECWLKKPTEEERRDIPELMKQI